MVVKPKRAPVIIRNRGMDSLKGRVVMTWLINWLPPSRPMGCPANQNPDQQGQRFQPLAGKAKEEVKASMER